MQANLFLNGSFTDYTSLVDTTRYTLAADGGVRNAIQNGCTPAAIIGDGDSVSTLPEDIKTTITPIPYIKAEDQDYTDFEKALKYLEKEGYTAIFVYCFEGDRIDHMLAGLSAVAASGLEITLYSAHQSILKLPKTYSFNAASNETISLIPYPLAKGVQTTGLVWDINNALLELGESISISNRAKKGIISITYSEGTLFLIRSISGE